MDGRVQMQMRRSLRLVLWLTAVALAAGAWFLGPPPDSGPPEAAAGPYIGRMCADVASQHFDSLGDVVSCFESFGGHGPRTHVNQWDVCVSGLRGSNLHCRADTTSCDWDDGHTPPAGGVCGHVCPSPTAVTCTYTGHYDTPHTHSPPPVIGTRTRPTPTTSRPTPTTVPTPTTLRACSASQHRDGGSSPCHSHPVPFCTTNGFYTTISGTGHGVGTTSVCAPRLCSAGWHRDARSRVCHSHPRPFCTTSGTYTTISGTGHGIGTTSVCAPTTPVVSVTGATVDENVGAADFTVTLSRSATSAVTVDVATSDGTATAGSDYVSVNRTVTIPAGQTREIVSVSVLDDTADEPDETFTLRLSNPSNADLASNPAATTTIRDNDADSAAPTDVVFGCASSSGVFTLAASWDPPAAGASGYKVQLSSNPVAWHSIGELYFGSGSATSVTATAPAAGIYYAVIHPFGVPGVGNGVEVQVSTDCSAAPWPALNLDLVCSTPNPRGVFTLTATWDAPSGGADAHTAQISTDRNGFLAASDPAVVADLSAGAALTLTGTASTASTYYLHVRPRRGGTDGPTVRALELCVAVLPAYIPPPVSPECPTDWHEHGFDCRPDHTVPIVCGTSAHEYQIHDINDPTGHQTLTHPACASVPDVCSTRFHDHAGTCVRTHEDPPLPCVANRRLVWQSTIHRTSEVLACPDPDVDAELLVNTAGRTMTLSFSVDVASGHVEPTRTFTITAVDGTAVNRSHYTMATPATATFDAATQTYTVSIPTIARQDHGVYPRKFAVTVTDAHPLRGHVSVTVTATINPPAIERQ